MDPGDEAYAELCQTLRQEAAEQVEHIGAALVQLERGLSIEERAHVLEDAFRQAHNLKGAAGSLGFTLTAHLAHAIESVLGALSSFPSEDALEWFDTLHRGLSAVVDALSADPGAESHPNVTPIIEELLRVPTPSHAPGPPPGDRATKAPTSTQHFPHDSGLDDFADGHSGSDGEGTRIARPPASRAGQAPISELPLTPHTLTTSGDVHTSEDGGTTIAHPILGAGSVALADDTLRVSMRKLNALMTQVGELLAARLRTDQRLAELRELLTAEEQRLDHEKGQKLTFRDVAPISSESWNRRVLSSMQESTDQQQTLVRRLRELVKSFEADALHSTILSGELQEDIRRIQTFPLASVLDPLPRAVRNMAREAGKDVDLVIEGAEVELDKKVLGALRDPLYHLLRNAVDHGIEPPDARKAAKKAERGKIVIRAEHRGNSIQITLIDDGPGVDLDKVRDKAVALGLVTKPQAEEMSEPRVLDLLFAPGMTTRAKATGMSGRGVGLDAVRTMIENLHGTVSVETARGRGTTISITLPLTIYVVHALVVRVAGRRMALPISAVQRILRIAPTDIVQVEQSDAIMLDGQPRALMPLSTLLDIKDDTDRSGSTSLSVVVVGSGNGRFALIVDEIVGDDTLLAKNFEPPLVRVRNAAGATILGDGSVVLMLNPVDLLRTASAQDAPRGAVLRADAAKRVRVLLADDSFTTRALERSVFELAGFEVVACADGQEAFSTLQQAGPFDIVVSDVSMPRMTGLELCAKIRNQERYRSLPVVLVTSLGSPDDKRKGMEVGADAYIVKSEFDHEQLVATVQELLGRN